MRFKASFSLYGRKLGEWESSLLLSKPEVQEKISRAYLDMEKAKIAKYLIPGENLATGVIALLIKDENASTIL